MIRRFTKIRPALTYGFVLLWTLHFSFGMFYHYHPEYVHAHEGELNPHAHGGHFHSLEIDALAHWVEPGHAPLVPGETHHHSESMPGGDSETVQYDSNKSSLPKVQKAVDTDTQAVTLILEPEQTQLRHAVRTATDAVRILLWPHALSERSPPLRL